MILPVHSGVKFIYVTSFLILTGSLAVDLPFNITPYNDVVSVIITYIPINLGLHALIAGFEITPPIISHDTCTFTMVCHFF